MRHFAPCQPLSISQMSRIFTETPTLYLFLFSSCKEISVTSVMTILHAKAMLKKCSLNLIINRRSAFQIIVLSHIFVKKRAWGGVLT